MKHRVPSGVRKWVMPILLCWGQTTAESCTQFRAPRGDTYRGPCGGQQIGWSRNLESCPIKGCWRNERLSQRILRYAVVGVLRNVKNFHVQKTCSAHLVLHPEPLGWSHRRDTLDRCKEGISESQNWPKVEVATFKGDWYYQRHWNRQSADLACRRRGLVWCPCIDILWSHRHFPHVAVELP